MKIKRIIASDMREAMRQVRQLFGDEAVILSNRACPEGVELVAAIDFDEQAVRLTAGRQSPHRVAGLSDSKRPEPGRTPAGSSSAAPAAALNETSSAGHSAFQTTAEMLAAREQAAREHVTHEQRAAASTPANASTMSDVAEDTENRSHQISGLAQEVPGQAQGHRSAFAEALAELNAEPVQQRRPIKPEAKPHVAVSRASTTQPWMDRSVDGDALGELQQEIGQLRELFERQLSVMEWHRYSAAHPLELETRERLHSLGLPQKLARAYAESAVRSEPDRPLTAALRAIGDQIGIPKSDLVQSGGIYAFVGPTGVGKTTTLAKLAAQAVLAHGRDSIALITTDRFRIGAQEQLRNYARILNIPLHVARDEQHLAELLPAVADRHLVLIDTAGMSPRDFQMMDLLKKMPVIDRRLKLLLVLSAQAQYSAMQDAITRFKAVPLAGMILTKLDETLSLGSALAALVQSGLPLCCTGTGQRVPEDLWYPTGADLITQAIELGQNEAEDEEPEFAPVRQMRA